MNLPKFALEHKPIIFGFAILLLGWGLSTFLEAPRREDPEFIIREALVITEWPGATAEQVEKFISNKVEKTAANIKQVRRVQSKSYVGRSVVQVSAVDQVTAIQNVWNKLRAEMKLLQPALPAGASSPAVDDNFGDTAALILALYQDPASAINNPYSPRDLEIYAKRLRDHLMDMRPMVKTDTGRLVPITTDPSYIARLNLFGIQPEVIYLETDAGHWSKIKLSSQDLEVLLSARNVVRPAGVLTTDDYRITTKLSGEFNTARDIDKVVVGRVATGAESPSRETLSEFARRLEAGEGIDDVRTPSYDVPVYLDDIDIKVKRDYLDPPNEKVRYGDTEHTSDAIILSFTMKPGENITWLGDSVDRLLSIANDTFLPPDIRVEKVSNPPFFVQEKIDSVLSNLLQAVFLVLLILGLLAGLRVAAVTATVIPLIMLSAIALMRIWNVEIEQISLAALIIALGLLVDNAIVTSENTTRFLNAGMERTKAVIEGCNQVSSSLLWSSLTTIGVFIPMAFVLEGSLREYVFSLPVVVTLTLLISWLCAMTVTPIMNFYLLKPSDGQLPIVKLYNAVMRRLGRTPQEKPAQQEAMKEKSGFMSLCHFGIRMRAITISGAFVLLAAALMLPVNSSFFPFSDRNQFVIDVWLPETASIYKTDKVTQDVEKLVRHLSGTTWDGKAWVPVKDKKGQPVARLANMAVYVGDGGPRFYSGLDPKPSAPYYANLVINSTDQRNVEQYVADIRRAAWQGIGQPGTTDYIPPVSGARIVPQRLVMGTPVASPIEYRIIGPRLASEAVLRNTGEQIKKVLRDSGLVWDVHDSWGVQGLQFDVDVKEDAANMAGVTNNSLARTLSTYYDGQYLTTFREGDKQIPVMLRLPPDQRQSVNTIKTAYVEGENGKVPLEAIAKLDVERAPLLITRYQRERMLGIQARPEPGLLARDILGQLESGIAKIEAALPPGYHIENGGIEEQAEKGERANSRALGVGIVLVIFCLLLQYNSSVKPLLILLTVPLSIIGGMLGIWVRGIPLGFMETLGFLALFGTVLNAAILMIDFAEELIRDKYAKGIGRAAPGEKSFCGLTRESFRSALVEAAEARMMPIFMTTATTVAGLMSLMFGGGPLFMGLATVFAVGLIVGSAITLFVLPALMAVFVENFHFQLVKTEQPEPAPSAQDAAAELS